MIPAGLNFVVELMIWTGLTIWADDWAVENFAVSLITWTDFTILADWNIEIDFMIWAGLMTCTALKV